MKKASLGFLIFILVSQFQTSIGQPRIITAGSAITETVCALGDCDKIIASDRTSLYPAHIQQLPSIGYRDGIHAEGIIGLKPTLVIAEKDYVEDVVLQQLQSVGIKLLVIDRTLSLEGTKTLIQQIAAVLGREAEGKKITEKLNREFAEVKLQLQQVKSQPKVVCVYNRGAGTISVGGTNSFADILQYVGARNPLPQVEGYKPLNAEALTAANPDYYLLLESGLASIGGVEGFIKTPGVAQTTGGQKKNVIALEGVKLTNFGPRLGEVVKELVVLLHPELKAARQ